MDFYFYILLIILLLGLTNNKNLFIYTPERVFKYIETNGQMSKSDLDSIKSYLGKTFSDVYAFNEISKNPPQPDFDSEYYDKINIQNEINNINTDHGTFYTFYQDIKKVFSKLKDGHTDIEFNKPLLYLNKILFFDPVELSIKNDTNNEIKIFATPNDLIDDSIKKYFKNYEEVFNIINKNKDKPIKSIKGKNPFDYIRELCSKYYNLRNVHGSFTYNYYIHNRVSLNTCPLSLNDLTNFKVVYENEDSFETDFILGSEQLLSLSLKEENKLNDDNETKIEKLFKLKEDIKYFPNLKNFPKLITFDKFGIHTNFDGTKNMINSDMNWDYSFDDYFKCRVDDIYQVNVIFISTYYTEQNKYNNFVNKIKSCAKLFDTNDYKIIMINSMNGGGYVILSQMLLELLSPHTSINIYSSLRATNSILNNYNTYLYDLEGNIVKTSKLMENKIKVNYGDGITDTIISPFLIVGKQDKIDINEIKSKFKNPRKPTDIIVFTDGFSFSAASLFIKYMQYYGGGITVGYFGDPEKREKVFDSSLSPSAIMDTDSLNKISPDGFRYLYLEYGVQMQIAGFQTFSNTENYGKPLEFQVTPVDEVINFYDIFYEDYYDKFILEAKNIFQKYENECNPENKKLYLIVKECDKNFTDEHAHGGYICNDDGFWQKECVITYCDYGYIIDYKNNKCKIDAVLEDDDNYTLIIILSVILAICALILIILVIMYCKNKRRNKLKGKNIYGNNNLQIGLHPDEIFSEL